ncbi:MAG: (2Fe-2S)-binding protein [Melioribacteraceae bacterium]|nr:(2Fe-2S)-binding protein [Melioribacteraceae bacterium]MCF8356296.1 (2Fe-2S)-binding protein [Melioribacteraceae bacterium]MCF8393547.1 (2Fe-2S)-binding protein [Melioribacteraceae bacterium]MCF8419357.1 (2Fe-2S)-binding protein [Melioribacteraceae bacterium]
MPKITIDGKQFDFNHGQTIIETAKENGIEIPHFCWHPKLSISGNCRICLVEVEKMPKLVIACSTLAADGMVVNTQSDKTIAARNAVMEFILINHPLDCPICDEAGECKLQDYAFKHGTGESRFVEEKQHKDKRVELGPRIMFDAERCISCSRCIRFSDEIAGRNQLTFIRRGDRVTITTFPGEEFDNPYTMNTIDICPVGALTSKDFRFKSRVWEMSSTNSVCTGCARGCNTEIWVRDNKIQRLTPRINETVNGHWMCDDGRLNTFKHVNNEETRIDGPHIRVDGQLTKVTWNEAVKEAVKRLKSFNNTEIAFIGSAFATVEDNYAFQKFSKANFNATNLDFARHVVPGSGDDILICEDKTPNSLGAVLTGIQPVADGMNLAEIINGIKSKKIKALYIMEDDIAQLDSEYETLLAKLDLLIVHASNKNKTTTLADILLPVSTYAEKHGTIVNVDGMIQRMRPAVATEELERSLDQMPMSRWDKFGTKFDRWARGKKYDAKPSWKILGLLSQELPNKLKYKMAEDVFEDVSQHVKEFSGLDYDLIGEMGVKIKSDKITAKV